MKVGVSTVSFSSNLQLIDALEKSGFVYKLNPYGRRLSQSELIDFLSDCDSAIIGLDKIDDEVIGNCPKLKLISKYGVGLDNIDFEACNKSGVKVRYSTGVNKRSVSELALAMILGLSRNVYKTSALLKKGIWNKTGGFELTGKKIGIIGYGNIGQDLAMLLQPFNVSIYANDINSSVFESNYNNVRVSLKEEVFSECDIISLHTPLTSLTENLISNRNIGQLKDGVILINTARGGLINELDVFEALKKCKVGGLGIDAYVVEPPLSHELLMLENVICTPHIGGNSAEAVLAMGISAINNLL